MPAMADYIELASAGDPDGVAEVWVHLARLAEEDAEVAAFLEIIEPWAHEWAWLRLNS